MDKEDALDVVEKAIDISFKKADAIVTKKFIQIINDKIEKYDKSEYFIGCHRTEIRVLRDLLKDFQ